MGEHPEDQTDSGGCGRSERQDRVRRHAREKGSRVLLTEELAEEGRWGQTTHPEPRQQDRMAWKTQERTHKVAHERLPVAYQGSQQGVVDGGIFAESLTSRL